MIPWIQVYSNFPQHPKTARLADALGLKDGEVSATVTAAGILVSLWTWAAQNAYDGDLSGCPLRAIAGACHWRKRPERLLEALKASGWIDADMRLHDWEEYTMLLIDQNDNRKANDRERAKKYRDRKKKDDAASRDASHGFVGENASASRDGHVTVTPKSQDASRDASRDFPVMSQQNHAPTKPNQTKERNPSSYEEGEKKESVTVTLHASAAAASAAAAEKCAPAVDREAKRPDGAVEAVLKAFRTRIQPVPSPTALTALAEFVRTLGPEVCLRAIDEAMDANAASWGYVRRILADKQAAGVKSLADWDALEQQRRGRAPGKAPPGSGGDAWSYV